MSQQDALMDMTSKVAALMEQFERRCERLEQHQLALAAQLQQTAQQIPTTLRRSIDENVQALPDAVMRSVRDGVDKPIDEFERRLRDSQMALQNRTQSLSTQLQDMELLQRRLRWKIVATVIGSLLLLLIGGGWLLGHYRREVDQYRIAADLLRAYNQADVTLCGNRLCAHVDSDGRRHGDKGQYQEVEPRP